MASLLCCHSLGGRRSSVQTCIVGLTLSFVALFFIAKQPASEVVKMHLSELARNNLGKLDEDGDRNNNWVVGILPSSLSSSSLLSRNLLLDATTLSSQSSSHEVLKTFYDGDVVSTSIEFTLQNHNANGEYAIISGLGLNVQTASTALVEIVPCRVKVYTKRGEGLRSAVENFGTVTVADIAAYRLALDARVLCQGTGKETLLPSELFVANYRLMKKNGPVVVAAAAAANEGLTTGGNVTESTIIQQSVVSPAIDGESRHRRTQENVVANSIESGTNSNATAGNELSLDDKDYPLLIPPYETLSLYIVVTTVGDTTAGTSFSLLSSSQSALTVSTTGEAYTSKADDTLSLFSGLSLINGYKVNENDAVEGVPSNATSGTFDEQKILQVKPGSIFNGAIYYDIFSPTTTTLDEYNNMVESSFLQGGGVLGKAGCEQSFETGLQESVGSYGMMFDVTSNIDPNEVDGDIEIFGLDLYIINLVNASFDVFVRKNTSANRTLQQYMSYSVMEGQTSINTDWDLIATGSVEGKGVGIYSPIPNDAWKKTVVLRPGQSAGFYVTVKSAPDLRYRNSLLPEGSIFKSDGNLNVGVGRSWGIYPLHMDGTDAFFSQREFSGVFKYHMPVNLCPSTAPSISSSPTATLTHPYAKEAEAADLCPEEGSLETTFEEGTGSFGALFDVYAKTKVMLTGINLYIDWNTGTSANVLVYARTGSWYGHQNNADSWPHLLVNTTLNRPVDFPNRTKDGPYLNLEKKKSSAVIPRNAFTPLEMKTGEVWAFYVCTSLADVRYTIGTKLGDEFASNSEISVMEGAGGADYPPFLSGTPAVQGVEYTFYTPRQFNGILIYDHIAECASTAPSSMNSIAPTSTPILTTNVTYTFYVEHSPEISWSVKEDMSSGVRNVLNRFMGGADDMLYKYVIDDDLAIGSVVGSDASPDDIDYICYPTPPETCSPISVLVEVSHLSTASSDDVMYALLRQSINLPSLIVVDGYTIQYIGERTAETASEISMSGVPSREMGQSEQEYFANTARDFLNKQLSSNDKLKILSVTVNGQVTMATDDIPPSIPGTVQYRAHSGERRQLLGSNNIQVSVKGSYTPPPDIDFGAVVETSINSDPDLLAKELKKPPPVKDGVSVTSDYFDKVEVQGARQIKMEPIVIVEDNALKSLLNFVAMSLGGLVGLLSLAFLLRPHRRRAICSSRLEDKFIPTNEDHRLLDKMRKVNESSHTFLGESYRSSENDTEHALRLSGFSSQQSKFSSKQSKVFDSRAPSNRGLIHPNQSMHMQPYPPKALNNSNRSGTTTPLNISDRSGRDSIHSHSNLNASYTSRRAVPCPPPPPGQYMSASYSDRPLTTRGGPPPSGQRLNVSYRDGGFHQNNMQSQRGMVMPMAQSHIQGGSAQLQRGSVLSHGHIQRDGPTEDQLRRNSDR